ncbi:glutamate/tyrosine decarboxylase-like PLP-dependent enzyme [Dyadobacter sp. BE34]|uniref:Glutamate/tyrosine decarboxylase-like PLP-dependent enzyme n=1 Tax=Dyadobacter fermentans TaxID=94254 RepID=A0ABU1QZG1_9BACT|nr:MULTISPECIES: pyridoxal-dependent decarboxylase [Dyadobacter]MDR6805675.1 glutamate/tyrosine decarboxylase-like PLP-dependent enzyme [Dyadobacter fermentans]MDR7042565.1 glutamate/tyrosine decarboxylase-like PLP-dependent enzyme [Dyadobacter sp. BE242]MDR7196877.1 glutamate/tyrosine decarboxylase-like PLP-dependent enzyme [Dyadobacter sp. BE34]MDR7215688.1 glutamate/tyrosine decarboxylase-like PLP-dependent enzyme [Dyadobacter sp. BE31]MDR7263224.1 glutamate/tyrosine decarboxylase-like PLP-
MLELFENELNNLKPILDEVTSASLDFLENIAEKPTYIDDQTVTAADLLDAGIGAAGSLEVFRKHYEKLMVASPGPRYWGFVTGGATPAAIAGDWLTAVYDQNTQSTQGAGDVSAILEKETIRLLCQLLHLPEDFNGGFVTGATMSNFTGLAVARQWAGERSGRDVSREGVSGDLVVMAATPHSSVVKSLGMLGIGSNNVVRIQVSEGREAMDLADFEQKLIEHQYRPIIVNCSAGTVNTVDFDDIKAIVALKQKYPFWLHIDAAFGGFAACLPAQEHLLAGWEQADSITIDCHKWLNVPYDSAVSLVRKEHSRLQVSTFQNSNAPYLGDPSENFSYLNFLPENSRRFRALPAWFSLTAYGRNGFEWIVQNSIARAQAFGTYIQSSEYFELLAPVRLNVVCFRLKSGRERMPVFLDRLNRRGKVFMTPTLLSGEPAIRAAFVNYRTAEEDILIAIREMEEVMRIL